MKAEDVTANLAALFPFFFGDAEKAKARTELYANALASVEGDRLAEAFKRTMAGWKAKEPPLPAHILENLPALPMKAQADADGRLPEDQVEAIMRELVTSETGRHFVEADLAAALQEMVRRREITGPGQLSRTLFAKLRNSRLEFERSLSSINPGDAMAGTLTSMGEGLKARAERVNAKWRAFLQQAA